MNRFTSLLFAGSMASMLFGGLMLAPAVAHADAYGLDDTAKATPFASQVKNKKTLPQLVGSLLNIVLALIGLLFLALAVYGGFRWMTAQGNPKSVQEGRETLINATVGIILIVSAYTITNFIFTDVIDPLTAPVSDATSPASGTTPASGDTAGISDTSPEPSPAGPSGGIGGGGTSGADIGAPAP